MIPDFQSIMLPLMNNIQDGQEHSTKLTHDQLAKHFNLTEEERNEFLPSGNQRIFYNRVFWAKAHLKMAGLIENTRRGYFKITTLGMDALSKGPAQINIAFLKQFPGYKESITSSKSAVERQAVEIESPLALETPQESLDHSYLKIKFALEEDVLSKVKSCSPYFFEKLVVKLLMKMGYGGTSDESGIITGKSGDEGIDGVIKQDPLGLDMIYIQAKKWDSVVSRPEIQKFAGALLAKAPRRVCSSPRQDFRRKRCSISPGMK
jgi:restriction system protein